MEIIIMGGGVVGVTTAYQLLKDGHQVTVLDRQAPGIGGASYGNAGSDCHRTLYCVGFSKSIKNVVQFLIPSASCFPHEISG